MPYQNLAHTSYASTIRFMLNQLLHPIDRFNSWYDRLPEPYRFLMLMCMVAGAIVPLQFGPVWGSKAATLVGVAALALLSLIGLRRAFARMSGKMQALIYCAVIASLSLAATAISAGPVVP